MNIKSIKVIHVGKIKTSFWKEAYTHYSSRIKHFCTLNEISVKDADANLPKEIRQQKEGEAIAKHLQANDFIICLDEHGKTLPSLELAELCDKKALEKNICFIIGGAYGLSKELLQRADMLLCFGKQTLPHELALVLLSEQIFRTCAILKKTGYHHE